MERNKLLKLLGAEDLGECPICKEKGYDSHIIKWGHEGVTVIECENPECEVRVVKTKPYAVIRKGGKKEVIPLPE